ncbi:SWIM zinc finger domain-containing protein [Geitlerinema sp. PCC 7407]|uniref:SWIM zinc finger family protein n=1 Tax=Geitlerinema sp. PCC 7407 TaxID=1173025 RepID=UPI00029F8F3D|nr:SWIM zinc finger family protein [Geitlerinema sp. PCC 7407]AFY65988.1 zinc finger SWIM domain-containing protein [Geitlerinema sp. PCC 7407]
MVSWTAEQILALSPDASSTKNGKGLASLQKWSGLGRAEDIIWGECKGSGKDPYRTQIDCQEPAFRCSCPSRKFPCKHALGLFLLLASQASAFAETDPPPWVAEWIQARSQQAVKKAEKQQKAATVDPAAQAKRVEKREAKIRAGLEDLTLWMHDLIRQGLGSVQSQPYAFWDGPAARLVDAQAPGLARRLKELAGIAHSGTGWTERLLAELGQLYLLVVGYQRLEAHPAPLQADLRTLVGWTQNQEELLAIAAEPDSGAESCQDVWQVLGKQVEEEERQMKVQRVWLWGQTSDRPVLVLSFAHGNSPLDTSLVPGSQIEAEVVFYPSNYPLRGVIKARQGELQALTAMAGHTSIADAIAHYGQAIARNPWLEQFPLRLEQVIPFQDDGTWWLRDAGGTVAQLSPRFIRPWHLLAFSGGHPVAVFGEWNGSVLMPLSTWAHGQFWQC